MRKFLFDTAFGPDGEVLSDRQKPIARFLQVDLDAARSEGFEAGKAEGRKEAAQFSARLHTEAVTAAAESMRALLDQLDDQYSVVREDAAQLSMAIARAIAGAALERFGEANATAIIAQALHDLRDSATARLSISPPIAEAVGSLLSEQPEHLAAPVRLVIDPDMSKHAVRLEFSAGQVAFEPQQIERRIVDILSSMTPLQDETR